MNIANIVTKDIMDLGPEFNIVSEVSEIENTNLPTLIIGCEFTRSIYGEKLDFQTGKISDNIFWTFTKKELRKNYIKDLENFIQYSYEYSVSKLHYIYLDLIHYNDHKIKKIVRKILSFNEIYSYKLENMIYLHQDNLIIGVNLDLVKLIGLDVGKVVDKIKNKSVVFLEDYKVIIEYKNYMERLDNKAKYIPFIYSINNYDKNPTTSILC